MSLPRDLVGAHPRLRVRQQAQCRLHVRGARGSGWRGGELAIETITEYLDIPINHVVNVDFGGFLEAVNAIDCVYVDVDRHYYNPTGGEYAEIDVKAGYQRLCGYQALQYVRYPPHRQRPRAWRPPAGLHPRGATAHPSA